MRPRRIRLRLKKTLQDGSIEEKEYDLQDTYANCVDCGFRFCFSAEEHHKWCVQYGIPPEANPKRCRKCRTIYRRRLQVAADFQDAKEKWKKSPKDPQTCLTFGRAFCRFHDIWKSGNAEECIACLKRIVGKPDIGIEACYWLGKCYLKIGRINNARKTFYVFLESTNERNPKLRVLIEDARKQFSEVSGIKPA